MKKITLKSIALIFLLSAAVSAHTYNVEFMNPNGDTATATIENKNFSEYELYRWRLEVKERFMQSPLNYPYDIDDIWCSSSSTLLDADW